MKASDVLKGAAELLVTKGHCKHLLAIFDNNQNETAFCARGALWKTETGDAMGWGPVSDEAEELVDLQPDVEDVAPPFHGGSHMVAWNNRPERTRDEVVRALDAAYILALQEEGLEPEDVL